MKQRLAYIFILFTIAFSGHLFADDTITLIHGVEYKPYYYSVTTGSGKLEGRGFLVDLIRGAAQEAGIPVSFEVEDGWTRCINLVRQNRRDGMFPIFKTEEREEFMIYDDNAVLAYETNIVVSRKEDALQFDGDFSKHRYHVFGVIPNYSYGAEFDNAVVRKQTGYTETELMEILHSENRFDFIVGNRDVLRYLAHEMGIDDELTFHEYELSHDPLYVAFSTESISHEEVRLLAKAIADFKKTAAYSEILSRFNAGEL